MADEGQQEEQVQQESQETEGATPETDWKTEAAKWQALAKKHEDRAKGNAAAAKKLADIEAANQTAQEKAEAAAKAAEERAKAATLRVASAEVRAALAGVVPDPAAVAEDLDVSRFLTADGEVDAEKLTALKARYAALAPSGPRAPSPNPAQGSGGRAKSFAEIVADAEKASSGSRGDTLSTMRLKSRMALKPQQ